MSDEANGVLKRLKIRNPLSGPDDFIAPTRTGNLNTASNMENRLKIILRNAGVKDAKGGVHILRKTFATRMYESGARVEEIAAYIGDLPSTTRKHYVAIRKKMISGGEVKQIVRLPAATSDVIDQ